MYVKNYDNLIGKKVILTEKKESMKGYFEIGSIVTIVDIDPMRGYSFVDDDGNKIIEAGFTGFYII
jgi:hypothetical protein